MTSSLYLQGYNDFLIFKFHSLISSQVINFSYTANYSTSAIRMLPRELRSISRLATHADQLLFLSSLLQVTSSNLTAHIISQTSLSLIIYRDEPTSLFGFFIHRIRCFLCGALIGRKQRYQEQYPCSTQIFGAIRSYSKGGNHNLFRRLSRTTNCDGRFRL